MCAWYCHVCVVLPRVRCKCHVCVALPHVPFAPPGVPAQSGVAAEPEAGTGTGASAEPGGSSHEYGLESMAAPSDTHTEADTSAPLDAITLQPETPARTLRYGLQHCSNGHH
jgi:hypothetical protein